MWVVPNHVPDGQVQFQMPMPADRMTTFEGSGLPFPSAHVAYNPSQSGYVPLKGRYCIKGAHPTNVYVRDDGVLGTPEALLRYKSSGRDVFEAVRVHGVNTIPHRNVISHVARTGPDFYDAGEQPQRSQEAILRASEYGHDYDATIDYGWGSRPRV
jgi:hypothetical protein